MPICVCVCWVKDAEILLSKDPNPHCCPSAVARVAQHANQMCSLLPPSAHECTVRVKYMCKSTVLKNNYNNYKYN